MRPASTIAAAAFALAASLGAAPAALAQTREDAAALERAQELERAGKNAEAAALLEKLVERAPSLADAHRLLGHAYFALDRRTEARAALVRAFAQGRLAPDVLARLAVIDRDRGARTPLLAVLRVLIVVEPDEPRWQELYADELADAGELREAERVLERLSEADPASGRLLLRLGDVRQQAGRRREAAIALEAAYRLGERAPGLERTIGGLLAELGDGRGALGWLERALAAEPDRREELALRCGRILVDLGEGEGARRLLAPVLESKDPASARHAGRLLLAEARSRGDAAAVAALAARLAALGDDDPRLFAALGMDALRRRAWAEAGGWLDRAVRSGEAAREVRAAQARAWIRAGDRARGRAALVAYIAENGLDDEAQALARELGAGGG